ncbi:MAG: AIR synthase-related protein [Balneolaceae bacterium]|nr:AIR synthase-related protein [Balneolaceae bacterium]
MTWPAPSWALWIAKQIIQGDQINKGDLLLGFQSSGIHTNGYSLARKVLFSEYEVDDNVEKLGSTVGEELLKVHRSYLALISELKEINGVNGFSHITGGGIVANTKRILPEGRSLDIQWDSWERPAIFELIQQLGNVPEDDMRATFNLGIGLIAVVDPDAAEQVKSWAEKNNEPVHEIGKVK